MDDQELVDLMGEGYSGPLLAGGAVRHARRDMAASRVNAALRGRETRKQAATEWEFDEWDEEEVKIAEQLKRMEEEEGAAAMIQGTLRGSKARKIAEQLLVHGPLPSSV